MDIPIARIMMKCAIVMTGWSVQLVLSQVWEFLSYGQTELSDF